jgi:hypothetical protein
MNLLHHSVTGTGCAGVIDNGSEAGDKITTYMDVLEMSGISLPAPETSGRGPQERVAMANERLRSAMLERGVTNAALAEAVEVDPRASSAGSLAGSPTGATATPWPLSWK